MGNRTQVAEVLAQVGGGSSTPSTSYNYDKLYRLTGVTGPSGTTTYSYDPLGNRASKILDGATTSYTYDRADRITSAGSTSYTVNANGNETARGTDSFSYDQANRLKSSTVGGATSTHIYDGDGKRVSKTVAGVTTSYVYDVGGGLPVLLDDGVRKYVWGASGLTYSVDKSSGAVQVYHADGLGSVRAITDSTGSVVQTYQTDEFGVPTATQGTSSQPFGYAGEQRDSEDGHVYLTARMYEPSIGRLVQRDLSGGWIGEPQSLGRYVYVQDRPTNLSDPIGLFALLPNPVENVGGSRVIKEHASLPDSQCFKSDGPFSGYVVDATCTDFPLLVEIPITVQTPFGPVPVPTIAAVKPPRGGDGGDRERKGGTPRSNIAQNKQFGDAVRQAEKTLGRKLSLDQIRELHDAISEQNMDFWEIVQEAVSMFGDT